MASDIQGPADDSAQTAHVGNAGKPTRADEPGSARADQPSPSAEDLDAREKRFTRARKPMGPVESATPETVPDEQ